jgi:hypothetical protein
VLVVVQQGYERSEDWSGKAGDSRNVRTENDLFMVESFIISASVLTDLSL